MFNIKLSYLDFENKVTNKKQNKTKKLNTKIRTAEGKIIGTLFYLRKI